MFTVSSVCQHYQPIYQPALGRYVGKVSAGRFSVNTSADIQCTELYSINIQQILDWYSANTWATVNQRMDQVFVDISIHSVGLHYLQ